MDFCISEKVIIFDTEIIQLHKGEKWITISEIVCDTIVANGEATSLDGKWLMKDNRLVFIDKQLAGIRLFSLDGAYLGRHINRGRGPNEVLSPFHDADYVNDDSFVAIGQGWFLYLFDSLFTMKREPYSFYKSIEQSMSMDAKNHLLKHPDPKDEQMYEFNYAQCKQIKYIDNKLLMSIVTEHISYNGYFTNARSKEFYRDSYLYLFLNFDNWSMGKMFGHYPPVYYKKNIPAFSKYNIDIFDNKIFTAFEADSLIYVRDNNGVLMYSLGFRAPCISNGYPETRTIEEHDAFVRMRKKEFGHYSDIKIVNGYLFRSYQKRDHLGYGLQIYLEDNLIGDITLTESLKIIGGYDGYFYGELPVDLENECFRILKFKL